MRLNIPQRMRAMFESTNDDASLKSKFAALECECAMHAKPAAANERMKSKWIHSHRWWLNRSHKSRWRQPQTIYFALYTYQPSLVSLFTRIFLFLFLFAVFFSRDGFTLLRFYLYIRINFCFLKNYIQHMNFCIFFFSSFRFVFTWVETDTEKRAWFVSVFLGISISNMFTLLPKKKNFFFLFTAHPVAFRSRRRLSFSLTERDKPNCKCELLYICTIHRSIGTLNESLCFVLFFIVYSVNFCTLSLSSSSTSRAPIKTHSYTLT